MKKIANVLLPLLILTLVVSTGALAQLPCIDYLGYAWESPGTPTKAAGDNLTMTGVADYADAVFGVDLGAVELTFYMYDLVSTGESDIGGGNTMISYAGGVLEIYEDVAKNADYGINPPNATAPPTFVDGDLFFRGSFNDFTLFMTAAGGGSYEGTLNGLAGSLIDGPCSGCAYTWGGAFTTEAGALVPEGYLYQMDGVFEIEAAVASEDKSWDGVKSLYR